MKVLLILAGAGAFSGATLSVLSLICSIIAVIALIAYGRRYISSQNIRAQLDAKDAVIHTHVQTVDALTHRVTALEDALYQGQMKERGHGQRIAELERLLREAQARYDIIREFAAPNLEKTLGEMRDSIVILLERTAPSHK